MVATDQLNAYQLQLSTRRMVLNPLNTLESDQITRISSVSLDLVIFSGEYSHISSSIDIAFCSPRGLTIRCAAPDSVKASSRLGRCTLFGLCCLTQPVGTWRERATLDPGDCITTSPRHAKLSTEVIPANREIY